MRICSGDSGGPWFRADNQYVNITGISSIIDVASSGSKLCVVAGGKMRACRTSGKVSWISSKMIAYGAGSCTVSGEFAQC